MAKKTGDVVWVVTMESEKFEWVAVGRTEVEAMAALRKTWDAQVPRAGGLSWAKFQRIEGQSIADYYGVSVTAMKMGTGYSR